MKSTFSFSLVFILGLALGYFVNVFFTNKPYYDLVRENKALRAQLENPTKAEDSLNPESCIPTQAAAQAQQEAPLLPEGHGDEAVVAAAPVAGPQPTLPKKASETAQSSAGSTQDVQSVEEMQDFLKATVPNDPLALLKARKPMDVSHAQNINGLYSGEILFLPQKNPKDPKWEVEMVIEGEFKKGQFVGRDEVRLFNGKGRNFSTSKSAPGSSLKHYGIGPNGSLLIETKGGDGYLQLFYFPRLERWSGHYLERKDLDQFEHMGYVHMFKR